MTSFTAKTVSSMDTETFVAFGNAVLDQLHDEGNFDLGSPCMVSICGLDYTPTEIRLFEGEEESMSMFADSIKNNEDFNFVILMQHCPSAEIVPFVAKREYVEEYLTKSVLPMLVEKLPIIYWQK